MTDVEILRNCSARVYTELQTTVRLYLMLPVALIGITANGVNVLVFLNRRMRKCVVNWFLLALSLSDLCLLVCTILFVIMPVVSALDGAHSLLLVKLQVYFFRFGYPVGIMAQMASVYYTTLVCLHRYIAICHPLRARQLTTKRSAKLAITAAAVFSVSFNVCRFWETGQEPCISTQYDDAILTQITISGLSANAVYRVIYSTVGYTLIKLIFPFFILLALTALMIRAMCQSKQLHARQLNSASTSVSCSRRRNQRTNIYRSPTRFNHHAPAHSGRRQTHEMTPPNRSMATSLIHVAEGLQRKNECMGANATCRSVDDLNIDQRGLLQPTTRPRATSETSKTATTHNESPRRSPPTPTTPRYNLSSRSRVRSAEATSREGRVTTMLLVIVGVFLLCNCPPFLNNIMEILLHYHKKLQRTFLSSLFRFSIELGNLLVAFNSASTIVIYITFSSKYIEALVAVFGGLWTKTTPAIHYVAATTTNNNNDQKHPLMFKMGGINSPPPKMITSAGSSPMAKTKLTRMRTNI